MRTRKNLKKKLAPVSFLDSCCGVLFTSKELDDSLFRGSPSLEALTQLCGPNKGENSPKGVLLGLLQDVVFLVISRTRSAIGTACATLLPS